MKASSAPEQSQERELLDSAQTRQRLGLSDHQLTRMRATRKIGYLKRGGRVLFAAEEVERVLRESEVPALRPVVRLRDRE
ncbi:helix-turn-helix domain-containing protein [Roseimicrobium sp. ORNL1]|uniref:helix-turn-helix domain-containing protein n=1 Tax=Roseimicrobium sp. ORNL1 TaxID=2711231 RepID=UPI0013E144D0|nr:helix-turn-helix domain-containing protein [Roseimicrobium sp. ORNL1]QIF00198.1 helix-turn-helix domain-containing protein [Roseimicrobium sp. ORNL1]